MVAAKEVFFKYGGYMISAAAVTPTKPRLKITCAFQDIVLITPPQLQGSSTPLTNITNKYPVKMINVKNEANNPLILVTGKNNIKPIPISASGNPHETTPANLFITGARCNTATNVT